MMSYDYDVIVIGGGPSGLMAAIAAMEHGHTFNRHFKVLLVDKGDKLGRKLGISGGGRCNVTNNKDRDALIENIPGNGRFLYSALQTFGSREIIQFFEGLGIALKEEDRGRMFPVSDRAKTVVQALINKVKAEGIEVLINHKVKDLLYENNSESSFCAVGVRLINGGTIRSRTVILASGGKSVPRTGSTGDGYAWAEAAGHTITELYPTEVPITSQTWFIRDKQLQGISLRDITLTVWSPKGKAIIQHEGDMIFTHFGISGPAALRCSQFVVKALKKFSAQTIVLSIDLFPQFSPQELEILLREHFQNEPKKLLKNSLRSLLPDRLIPILLQLAKIGPETTCNELSKNAWHSLLSLLKRFELKANGTLSIEEAFVTGGGVHLKEIDPKTMHSKRMSGLFFCGEILDIHGYTGGYNITAAFSTGHTAGRGAAEWIKQQQNMTS